jgi:serine/threonine protein kinase
MIGDLFGNTLTAGRFERDACAAATLSNPNVVQLYDFGHLAAGGAYNVMELIKGASWREHLKAAESGA